VLVSLLAALAVSPLGVRLGSAELTPPEPLPLGGYTARGGKLCELPGDRLEARAAVFEQGGRRLAVVSADLLTIPESLRDEVQKRLPARTDLFLAATHTHCAPDSQMLNRRMDFSLPGIARFKEKWLTWHADRIASAVRSALRAPSRDASDWEIAYGRRTLNRARRTFAHPDTLAVRLLVGGRPALTHYAAHAVLYGASENRPRTDFPGFIRGKEGLFLPGAIGDMSPASIGETPEEQVRRFAEAFEGGSWLREPLAPGALAFMRVPLGPLEIVPNPEFGRLNRVPQSLADAVVRRFAPGDGYLTLARIGKLALVGVPGEPTAELGRRIRSIGQGLGFRAVLTASHCNGWMGYILAPEDYDRGGYEASLAFHGREFGRKLLEKAEEGLRGIR
jgi:neutral ceramidase